MLSGFSYSLAFLTDEFFRSIGRSLGDFLLDLGRQSLIITALVAPVVVISSHFLQRWNRQRLATPMPMSEEAADDLVSSLHNDKNREQNANGE